MTFLFSPGARWIFSTPRGTESLEEPTLRKMRTSYKGWILFIPIPIYFGEPALRFESVEYDKKPSPTANYGDKDHF